MTEFHTKSLPSSLGTMSLVAGFMATHLLVNPIRTTDERHERARPYVDFVVAPSTHGEYAHIFAGSLHTALSGTEAELQSLYVDLLAKQERLGSEFEDVLFANLWTLYAR